MGRTIHWLWILGGTCCLMIWCKSCKGRVFIWSFFCLLMMLDIDQMKRRNESEEDHDVEMNGWNGNGIASSDPSPVVTPSGPARRASRPKAGKQSKNGPQTPGPSGHGGPLHPSIPTFLSRLREFYRWSHDS